MCPRQRIVRGRLNWCDLVKLDVGIRWLFIFSFSIGKKEELLEKERTVKLHEWSEKLKALQKLLTAQENAFKFREGISTDLETVKYKKSEVEVVDVHWILMSCDCCFYVGNMLPWCAVYFEFVHFSVYLFVCTICLVICCVTYLFIPLFVYLFGIFDLFIWLLVCHSVSVYAFICLFIHQLTFT